MFRRLTLTLTTLLLLVLGAGPAGAQSEDAVCFIGKPTIGTFYAEGEVTAFAIEDGGLRGSATIDGVEITIDGFPTVAAGDCYEVTGTAYFYKGRLVERITPPSHFVPVACD